MDNIITRELIDRMKNTADVAELMALATENGLAVSEKRAAEIFGELHKAEEINDDELADIFGGYELDCGKNYLPREMPREIS